MKWIHFLLTFLRGWGWSLSRPEGPGDMEQSFTTFLKSTRAEGSQGGSQNIYACNSEHKGQEDDGQHNVSFIHCEARGHKKSTASPGGSGDLIICRSPFTGPIVMVSTRPSEPSGRSA